MEMCSCISYPMHLLGMAMVMVTVMDMGTDMDMDTTIMDMAMDMVTLWACGLSLES